MPKGQAPRISDKSLKKKHKTKTAPDWLLDKSRRKGSHENKSSLKSGMDPDEYTLRKKPKVEYVKAGASNPPERKR